MKKYIIIALGLSLASCNKVEEKINETIDRTTETVKQKAQEKVKETIDKTVNETINSVTNGQDVAFNEVFPNIKTDIVSNYTGKKIKFPNGSPAYFLKYNANKEEMLNLLVSQPTTDESKSNKEFKKIDGQKFVDQITFFEKFIPEGVLDTSFLNDIKTDKSIEYYRVNRFPNKSTIIVNPKSGIIYQFVEVSK